MAKIAEKTAGGAVPDANDIRSPVSSEPREEKARRVGIVAFLVKGEKIADAVRIAKDFRLTNEDVGSEILTAVIYLVGGGSAVAAAEAAKSFGLTDDKARSRMLTVVEELAKRKDISLALGVATALNMTAEERSAITAVHNLSDQGKSR